MALVGERIGQYVVHERLGQGGMGTVYRATDEALHRQVALKILDTATDVSGARLRGEAAALAQLAHPGIATVYELIDDGRRLVMVMELVRGETLQARIERMGTCEPRHAAAICMQVLEALAHAHAAGVIHRDLKPANLILTEAGTIKIVDFGIARLEGSINLTSDGMVIGTPAYMSPEQVLGEPADERADLWAVGVVFYRLITDRLPFNGDTALAMRQSQVNDPPTPVHLVRAGVPPWVEGIVELSLAKAPEERFRSAQEFSDALARCLAAEDAEQPENQTERPIAMGAPGGVHGARRGLLAALSMGVAAAIVVAVAVLRPSSETAAEASASPTTTASAAIPQTPAGAGSRRVKSVAAAPAAATPAPVVKRPPAVFSKVKLLTVSGRSTEAHDAVLTFDDTRMYAAPAEASRSGPLVLYERIQKATYVHARDPRWDSRFSAPAGTIDVPGITGRPRHWLTVQTRDSYAILRLDGPDRDEILKVFSARAGISIDRPAGKPAVHDRPPNR